MRSEGPRAGEGGAPGVLALLTAARRGVPRVLVESSECLTFRR